jgi:hypothetical protein
MPSKDLSSHLFPDDDWQILGYGERGTTNWETERQMTSADLNWISEVVVRIPVADGPDDYFTLHGPWDEIEDLHGHIEDEKDHYGQAA